MDLIKLNKSYHLTISPQTLAMALLINVIGVSLVTVLTTRKILSEALIATVENRALLQQAQSLQLELAKTLQNSFSITLTDKP